MGAVSVRSLGAADEAAAEALLDEMLAGRHQARLGERIDVLSLAGAGAWDGDRLVGVVTWTEPEPGPAPAPVGDDGDDARSRSELAALAVALDRWGLGVGGILVETAAEAARAAGASAQWLVTTNDNLDALRLYQRHGYRLTELRAGAVDEARRAKPAIPEAGRHGIPLHDELVLERDLPAPRPGNA